MTIAARSENHSIVDLEQVLIHFISENDNSASPLVIVQGAGNDQKAIDV